MGHTNQTPAYHLPVFVQDDKPSWLGDFNNAMNALDEALATHRDRISAIGTAVENINNADAVMDIIKANDGSLSGLDADFLDGKHASDFASSTDVADLQGTFSNVSTLASQARSIAESANSSASEAKMRIVVLENYQGRRKSAKCAMSAPYQIINSFGEWVRIVCSAKLYDDDGYIATSTPGTFTIKQTGRYTITANVRLGNASDSRRQLLIRKTNGTELAQNSTDTTYGAASVTALEEELSAGDVIEMVINTPDTVEIGVPTNFTISRVR